MVLIHSFFFINDLFFKITLHLHNLLIVLLYYKIPINIGINEKRTVQYMITNDIKN
jgi:hypothetical protein